MCYEEIIRKMGERGTVDLSVLIGAIAGVFGDRGAVDSVCETLKQLMTNSDE